MHATQNQALSGQSTTGFGVVIAGIAIAASLAVGAVIGTNLATKAAPLAAGRVIPAVVHDMPEDAIKAATAPLKAKDDLVIPRLPSVATPGSYTGPGYDSQGYLLPAESFLRPESGIFGGYAVSAADQSAAGFNDGADRRRHPGPAVDNSGVQRATVD